jgi:hypothetical protein
VAVLARRPPKIGRLTGDFVASGGREGPPSILTTLALAVVLRPQLPMADWYSGALRHAQQLSGPTRASEAAAASAGQLLQASRSSTARGPGGSRAPNECSSRAPNRGPGVSDCGGWTR